MNPRKKLLVISDSAEFAENIINKGDVNNFDITSVLSYSDGLKKAQSGEFDVVIVEDLVEKQELPELISQLDSAKFKKCIIVSAEPTRFDNLKQENFVISNSRINASVDSAVSELLK